MKQLKASIKDQIALSAGFLPLNRYRIEAERHDGGIRSITREVMKCGNAVGVLAYDPIRDTVVLANEIRPGALVAGDPPYADYLVAGRIDGDETAIAAAVREMKEETGLELTDAQLIHPGAYASSGTSSEKIAVVFGVVDSSKAGGVHGNPAEDEEIWSVVRPALVFIEQIERGEISDLKTIVAGYWLASRRAYLLRGQ